jgi:hypothetical protein
LGSDVRWGRPSDAAVIIQLFWGNRED